MSLFDGIFGSPYSEADGYADSPRQGGLLGAGGWLSDPRNAARLQAFGDALLKAGSPSPYKMNWGGALGQGLSGFNQAGAQFDQQQFQKQMQELQMQQLKQSLNQKVDPRQFLGKVDVDKVTPDSIQKFLAGGGDYGQLQPVAPKRDVRDVNGQLIEVPQTGDPTPIYGQPKLPDYLTYGQDGKPMVNPLYVSAKSQIAAAGRPVTNVNVNTPKEVFKDSMTLKKDFDAQPEVKAFKEVQQAWDQISTAIKMPGPSADLAAATKFMKLLDPGSVVRESELALAMQASGAMDRFLNTANRVMTGEKLTPKQRQDFYKSGEALYNAAKGRYGQTVDQFKSIGKGYGLDERFLPKDVSGANAQIDELVNKYATPTK